MSVTSSTPGWKLGHPPFHDEIAGGDNALPPNGLELVQAHWFVRHGERTPVRPRPLLAYRAGLPQRYNLCHLGRKFHAAVLDWDESGENGSVAVGARIPANPTTGGTTR
ncbi:hypothetical protein BT69DRAFT_160050 [Atractiella rhizophila]|nr:hypothetical protein BT69DRAFT_160050 [Atractiella rhizophila]